MKTTQAISLAITAMRAQIHRYSVDANLHDQFGADYPFAITASKERKKLLEAVAILETIKSEIHHQPRLKGV